MTPTLNPQDFDYVRCLVHQFSSMQVSDDKAYLVETRLMPLVRQEGCRSLQDLVGRLRQAPSGALHRRVAEAMAIHETLFFRDGHPFEALATTLLPELLARRASERRLRIWSAACSTGQEPYSVAMLLQDNVPQRDTWDLQLLASDFSQEVLAVAKAGRYSPMEIDRGFPAELRDQYLRSDGKDWLIRPDVRQMVTFQEINLAGPWPYLPPMDVILLRNVLIYFDVPLRQAILAKVRQVLRPDGYLILGGAESTFYLDDGFEAVSIGRSVCYRLRAAANDLTNRTA